VLARDFVDSIAHRRAAACSSRGRIGTATVDPIVRWPNAKARSANARRAASGIIGAHLPDRRRLKSLCRAA
jgi:hypothetical protein